MTSAVLVFKDKSQQTDGSGPALFNLFNKRVKENLHIIFAMSPLSPEFGSFIASEWLLLRPLGSLRPLRPLRPLRQPRGNPKTLYQPWWPWWRSGVSSVVL